ncbi:MAG: hypothetical protein D6722_26905, partial [Bacteroidetes bacterium]
MFLGVSWLCSGLLLAQGLDYYLPAGTNYDPRIPTPASILGFAVGEWHVTHDQQLRYMERLASVSPRVRIDTIGYTYERRPLVHLTITSPAQQGRLEAIRQAQMRLSDPEQPPLPAAAQDSMPAVVWMGYSIHGNEA